MKLIGICGGSCSGKSTLVKALSLKLKNLTIIHLDDFFVGKSKINVEEIKNWEDPKLYRLDEYVEVLKKIKSGKSVKIEANSREARKEGLTSRTLEPNDHVIVEGFLTFYPEAARQYFDTKIYLDISEEEIIKRRYERMESGGGKYSDEYIHVTLIQEHRKIVVPQKQYADLILNATKATDILVQEVIKFINYQISG